MKAPTSVAYSEVKVGDRIWNPFGYFGKNGHWTRVVEISPGPYDTSNEVGLYTADGYRQYGHPREAVAIMRDEADTTPKARKEEGR